MVVQEDFDTDLVSSSLKSDKKHRLKQRFDVQRKLGQGTYGKVQLAVNRETGQEVAVKTIKKSKIENEQDLIRIRREIQIMSSIQHPHIIHIYEVFENKDKIVLVMQFACGGELYDYLSEKKVLSDLEARRVFRQIAAAVYYCHKNKICHRDLKLENILLDEKGNAKIADFGLSNVFDEKHLLNTYCGSPLYASPEIVKGVPYYGPEVDCWSMGVLLYTLVYGAMPFDGSNFKKLVTQISEGDYFEPKTKSNASELIRKLLTVNPNKRATIVDICMDVWVNYGYEHSLLQVAEDMANLTPVRLDLLLALAPGSDIPQEDLEQLQDEEVGLISRDIEKEIPYEEEEDEDYNPDTAANSFSFMKGSHASQLSISQPNLQEALDNEYEEESDSDFLPADIAVALQGECAKRLADSSFGASLARISSLSHQNKKTKKSDSSSTCINQENKANHKNVKAASNKSTEKCNVQVEKSSGIAAPEENKSGKQISDTNSVKENNNVDIPKGKIEKNHSVSKDKKLVLEKNPSIDSKIEVLANQTNESPSIPEEKVEKKRFVRPPGKIVIPKTFDSPTASPSPKTTFKVAVKSPCKDEVPKQFEVSSIDDTTHKEKEIENTTTEDINKNIVSNVPKEEKSSPVITEDKKNIAKDILKKGIAKAKLTERKMSHQSSIDSEASSCSTPVSSSVVNEAPPSYFKVPKPYSKEEEKNITSKAEIKLSSPQTSSSTLKSEVLKSAPLWDNAGRPCDRSLPDKNTNWSAVSSTIDSEMSGWREQMEESLRRLSPDDERLSKDSFALSKVDDDKPLVPIARSYKKFTFTKDGACITETKKIYTTPGADGSWTKVEKKTKITTRPGNAEEFEKFRDLHLRTNSPLARSDSQSSSGSNDVYDDIFDSWTGDTMMCNMRKMNNMFQKFSRDPFLRKERRRNPFRFFRRTESERNEREKTKYEIRSGRTTDRESSENEEDYDVHFDDSSAAVYGSQGLWQLLRSANKGLPGRVTIHHEPVSYGRSVSQDRSESSRFENNWKRSGSRASSGYVTGTRSQSRDRTESPREKVLRFVFESPRESLCRESSSKESPVRNEKWSMRRSLSRHNPRRDSGVGSDGYESEYSVRPSPSDELSHAGRVSSMSSVCSAAKQDMIRNFMKSWSKEFMSPPISPTSIGSNKEQFENLPESRKHKVEQWLHMNSEDPHSFYSDCPSGMSSRKSSASHSSSSYATMRPRDYLYYNRSSSDKLPDSDTHYFSSFQEGPRMRSHSLNKDSSFGESSKINLRTAAYSPVSEESFKDASAHHSDSSRSSSSVHRINFTFSDGKVSSSQTPPPIASRQIRHFNSPKDQSMKVESPPPANVKFEQISRSGQPVVQMRVSFNRGNPENQVIHVTSLSPQASKGLWEQQESDRRDSPSLKSNRSDFTSPIPRNPSPVPGIRQFSTEVQHSVGCSDDVPQTSVKCEIINAGNESPQNIQAGKNILHTNNCLPFESSIWDMACSQSCMQYNPELVDININAPQKIKMDDLNFIPNNAINSCKNPLQNESKIKHDNYDIQFNSNGANTPDSLEDLCIEQSLSEFSESTLNNAALVNAHELHPNFKQTNEFHVEVKPLGTLWNNCDTKTNSKFTEQENGKNLAFAQIQNISPSSSISAPSEAPDFQKKCLENTTSEIGSIWNQKNATQTFDLLKNLLSNDGLDSFSSAKQVLTSNCNVSHNTRQNFVPISDNAVGQENFASKHNAVIDNIEVEPINHSDKFHKMMPSLMDDLQSPKEVLRQAMKICESFEHFE